MPLQVSYMGTKRSIAKRVVAAINGGPPGPLLDLFSGICAVGEAVAPARQIWCNDVQVFAATVATSFFTSPILPTHADRAEAAASPHYIQNRRSLEERFYSLMKEERDALESGDLDRIRRLEHNMPNISSNKSLEEERACLARRSDSFPYRLFTITFSGGYFGLYQCIQIDSLRYAIDLLRDTGSSCEHQRRWMCLALCQAVSKVATNTGHFAQYLRVKGHTLGRFRARRRRSVWWEWLCAMRQLSPIGTKAWRAGNRVFSEDANRLLRVLQEKVERPAVVYADPPYTRDQYSRYYHIYETLLLYDYPLAEATGRYRPDRFASPYSMTTQVEEAMGQLIEQCARLGSRLVLSYPTHGLLRDANGVIRSLLCEHFRDVPSVDEIEHFHSSLGGSKGTGRRQVQELLFTAG